MRHGGVVDAAVEHGDQVAASLETEVVPQVRVNALEYAGSQPSGGVGVAQQHTESVCLGRICWGHCVEHSLEVRQRGICLCPHSARDRNGAIEPFVVHFVCHDNTVVGIQRHHAMRDVRVPRGVVKWSAFTFLTCASMSRWIVDKVVGKCNSFRWEAVLHFSRAVLIKAHDADVFMLRVFRAEHVESATDHRHILVSTRAHVAAEHEEKLATTVALCLAKPRVSNGRHRFKRLGIHPTLSLAHVVAAVVLGDIARFRELRREWDVQRDGAEVVGVVDAVNMCVEEVPLRVDNETIWFDAD
eukprot:PhM_4_TR7571/c0_g1_i1/m.20489